MRPPAVLLFGGLPTLLWIGQVIWIAVMSAIYIRVILVITRKEELLEELDPRREPGTRSAWYDSRKCHVVISKPDRTWVLRGTPNGRGGSTATDWAAPGAGPLVRNALAATAPAFSAQVLSARARPCWRFGTSPTRTARQHHCR
jgi:hypothetical protein